MLTFKEYQERRNLIDVAKRAGISVKGIDAEQLKMGFETEKEHDGKMGKDIDVVKSNVDIIKIALAHLREDPKYYTKLAKAKL